MLNLDVDDLPSEEAGQKLGHPFSSQPYHKPVLYPNPVRDFLYADVRLLDGETGTLTVLDNLGNTIFKSNLHEQQNKITVETFEFASGLYLIRFETSTGLKQADKFIVTK